MINDSSSNSAQSATSGDPSPKLSFEELLQNCKERSNHLEHELSLFHNLLDNTPDSIYFKDREGRFRWVNRAQCKILRIERPVEAIGKTDFDFLSLAHAEEASEEEKRIMESREPMVGKEQSDTSADGETRWFYASKLVWIDSDGNVAGTCGISRDVTKRKVAEDRLAAESNLLRTLIDNLPDFIYVKDRQHGYVLNNLAHLWLIGKATPEEAKGLSSFDFFPADLAQKYYDDEESLLLSGKALVGREEPVVDHDGRKLWVSTTKMPLRNSQGEITGLVCMSRDITAKREAEEALQRAKDELEIRVQERTAALVQEIAQHLKVQKALKESERKLQDANARLGKRVTQLNYLNSTSNLLARFTQKSELLPAIINAFTQRFPGVEALLCENTENGYEVTASSNLLNDENSKNYCSGVIKNLMGEKPTSKVNSVLIENRMEDLRLKGLVLEGKNHLVSLLLLPLFQESRLVATAVLLGPSEFMEFYEEEQTVLDTLAVQAAISLSNVNYLKELGNKVRLQGELDVAQRIQRRFTPQTKPLIPRVDLKGVYFPAYEVGGDYLDYFQTDSGHWVIVIADVSGKGIPAALVMTMLRSTFRSKARYETSAKNLLCAVNDLMSEDLDDKSFVTALCLIVNKEGTSMSYARAGHPPMLIKLGTEQVAISQLKTRGIALGMVTGDEFVNMMEESTLPLKKGDKFLVYTDGLVEARDPMRKTYGLNRLVSLFSSDREDPEGMLDAILKDVRGFTQSAPYQDDLTILAMEVVESGVALVAPL